MRNDDAPERTVAIASSASQASDGRKTSCTNARAMPRRRRGSALPIRPAARCGGEGPIRKGVTPASRAGRRAAARASRVHDHGGNRSQQPPQREQQDECRRLEAAPQVVEDLPAIEQPQRIPLRVHPRRAERGAPPRPRSASLPVPSGACAGTRSWACPGTPRRARRRSAGPPVRAPPRRGRG